MSVIRNFVILFISLFLGISTAAAAGWTTPPKLALIPDNYKESNEGYDILEEFKTLDYVQMLKDVDNYGKQVDACTDIKCCDKIAQKIAEQFLPDNTEKFMNNIRNIIKNTDEASTLVTGFSRYFGDKGLDSLVRINIINLTIYKTYLYETLSFYAYNISEGISLEDSISPENPQ